jgi:hypothetical protein
MAALFTRGSVVDKTSFESGGGEALAKFVVEDGRVLGLGIFEVVGDLMESRGNTVQTKAEVWFDKICDIE